jgi:uncharacterized protein YjbI with pentapeptide repeats
VKGRDLRGVNWAGQHLMRAHLEGADLRGADLRVALLLGADLRRADLRGADLTAAHLTRARFADVSTLSVKRKVLDLLEPERSDTRLNGARYNHLTRWPDGFQPVTAGAVLVR